MSCWKLSTVTCRWPPCLDSIRITSLPGSMVIAGRLHSSHVKTVLFDKLLKYSAVFVSTSLILPNQVGCIAVAFCPSRVYGSY